MAISQPLWAACSPSSLISIGISTATPILEASFWGNVKVPFLQNSHYLTLWLFLQPKSISLSSFLFNRCCRLLANLVALHWASEYLLYWGDPIWTVHSWCRCLLHSWLLLPGHSADSCSTCPLAWLPGSFLSFSSSGSLSQPEQWCEII